MGPILTALLGDHNHHDRLVELLPKLSKLQLVSDLQTPLNDPRQLSKEQCWCPLSLPAQYICQTLHESRKFPQVIRPLPSTISLHYRAGDSGKASLIVQKIDFAYDKEKTVCQISVVYGPQTCVISQSMYDSDEALFWDAVRAATDEQIGYAILAQTTRAHLDRLKVKTYGIFFPKIDPQYVMQTRRIVTRVAYSIYRDHGGGNRIPNNIEVDLLRQAPTCRACGKK